MSQDKKGVITIATGNIKYAEMAVDMALSYGQFHHDPISVLVDKPLKQYIEFHYSKIFHKILLFPDNVIGSRKRKFYCGILSPYKHSLYVDSDVIFLGDVNNFWKEGFNTNILVIGDFLNSTDNKIHHGFSTKNLINRYQIGKYLKTNSGCFYFNKEKSKLFFDECIKKHEDLEKDDYIRNNGFLGDEITIGLLGQQLGVSCYNFPSPMMWDNDLLNLNLESNTKPICHFIAPIPTKAVHKITKNQKRLRQLNNVNSKHVTVWKNLNRQRMQIQKNNLMTRIYLKIMNLLTIRK